MESGRPKPPEHHANPGDHERLSFAAEVFRNVFNYDSYTLEEQMKTVKGMDLDPGSFAAAASGMTPEDYTEYQRVLKSIKEDSTQ